MFTYFYFQNIEITYFHSFCITTFGGRQYAIYYPLNLMTPTWESVVMVNANSMPSVLMIRCIIQIGPLTFNRSHPYQCSLDLANYSETFNRVMHLILWFHSYALNAEIKFLFNFYNVFVSSITQTLLKKLYINLFCPMLWKVNNKNMDWSCKESSPGPSENGSILIHSIKGT